MAANFGMEFVGEIEGHRADGKVDNVTLRSVNEDLVGEDMELQLFFVDFFAFAEASSGGLELGNPEEIGGEMLDFASAIVLG